MRLQSDAPLSRAALPCDVAAKLRLQSDSQHQSDDFLVALRMQEEELAGFTASSRHATLRQHNCGRGNSQVHPALSPTNFMLLLATVGCIAVFVLALWQASWQIESLSINPLIGPNSTALSRLGSIVSSKIQAHNQWWRLATSLFVSSGVIHLFAAITSMWTLTKYLESIPNLRLPAISISAIYLVSGLTGAVVSVNLAYELQCTGATAGATGLLGAVWMEQIINFQHYRCRWMTLIVLTLLSAMFILLGLLPLVGMWIHVAALLVGALLLPLALAPKEGTAGQQRPCLRVMICLASLAIVAAILALGVLSIALNHGEIVQSCSPCQAMACISTHWWTCPAVIPALQAHSRCSFSLNNNATTTINCPSGSDHVVATQSIQDQIASCNEACATFAIFPPPGIPPSSADVLLR